MYSSLKSAIHWGGQPKSPAQNDLCETCGRKQRYIENGFTHPYCSRTCARSNKTVTPTSSCTLRGCRMPPKQAFGGFCSEAHGREAVQSGQVTACVQCKVQPRMNGQLCAACDRRSRARPRLRELDSKGAIFQSVAMQFVRDWQADGNPPVVEKVFEISPTRDTSEKYEAYRLQAAGIVQEIRAYHSSECICDFGLKDCNVCDWKSCGICNIIKTSFNIFAFGVTANNGKYGEGVYSARNAARADVFATSSTTAPYRVMLACDVLISQIQGLPQTSSTPSGAIICADDGERVFVASTNAIMPSFVILYTK